MWFPGVLWDLRMAILMQLAPSSCFPPCQPRQHWLQTWGKLGWLPGLHSHAANRHLSCWNSMDFVGPKLDGSLLLPFLPIVFYNMMQAWKRWKIRAATITSSLRLGLLCLIRCCNFASADRPNRPGLNWQLKAYFDQNVSLSNHFTLANRCQSCKALAIWNTWANFDDLTGKSGIAMCCQTFALGWRLICNDDLVPVLSTQARGWWRKLRSMG